jgi:hypothetical protein
VVKVVLLLLMRREKFVLQLSEAFGLVEFGFWFCFGLRAPSCWQRVVTIYGVICTSSKNLCFFLNSTNSHNFNSSLCGSCI